MEIITYESSGTESEGYQIMVRTLTKFEKDKIVELVENLNKMRNFKFGKGYIL